MYFSCIKTYVNSLKYTFTVIGIVALGIVIGLGCFGKMSGQAVTEMTQTMKEDYQAADLSLRYITEAVVDRAENLTLWDILNVIHDRSIKPLLIGEIEHSVERVVSNYTAFAEKIYDAIVVCVNAIVVALIIGVVLILLSQVISFFGVEICVRRRMSKISFLRLFLEMFVRFIMYILAAFIIFGLCTAFQGAATVLLCLLPILLVLFGLIAAWLTTDPKKVSFGKVVSFANFGWLLLANISMLAATALIGFFFYRLVNIVAAVLICVALLTVLLVAMDLSASSLAVKAQEMAMVPQAETAAEIPAAEIPAAEIPATEPTAAEMAVPETPIEAQEAPAAKAQPAVAAADDETTDEQAEALQNQLKSRLQSKLQEQDELK